jgi:hypothetical protein
MAGGANDAETLCSWRSKLTLLTLSDAVTILTTATQFFPSVILNGKPISKVTKQLGSSLSSAKPVTKRLNVLHAQSSSSARSSPRRFRSSSRSRQSCALSRAPSVKPTSSLRPSGVAPISTRMHCFSFQSVHGDGCHQPRYRRSASPTVRASATRCARRANPPSLTATDAQDDQH